MSRPLIVGAGPAGLTAAWELARLGVAATVVEQDAIPGGLSRTCEYKGYRFDIGGHRFFTKVEEVEKVWDEILGDDFIRRDRLSRIFYENRFFDYPLKAFPTLMKLGPIETTRIIASFAAAQVWPHRPENNLEEWIVNRFGRRLFEIFFKTYTEKVWGVPCTEIGADWAAQRIKDLNLAKAIRDAFGAKPGNGEIITTLIDEFRYPRLGPGMMWTRCSERLVEMGTDLRMEHRVSRIHHGGGRVQAASIEGNGGASGRVELSHLFSSMPIRELLHCFDPLPPAEVLAAASSLRYRDFLTVVLIVDAAELFPDNWIYIHSPSVKIGRIQNFKNWSPEMVPDPAKTSLGLEYFVQEGDELWSAEDADLIDLGTRECASLGLVHPENVVDGCVIRAHKAYPVYDSGYREALATIRAWLDPFENLQLIGRNGQHRYNNQDHSMLTGIYAARNVVGHDYDLWDVNVDEDYHEEASRPDRSVATGRSAPEPMEAAPARSTGLDAVRAAARAGLVLGLVAGTAMALLPLGANGPGVATAALTGFSCGLVGLPAVRLGRRMWGGWREAKALRALNAHPEPNSPIRRNR